MRQVIPRLHGRAAGLALVGATLAFGCDTDGGAGEPDDALSLGVPEPVLAARDVDRAALGVRVTVDGEPVDAERTETGWIVRTDVPEGEGAIVEVEWFETIDGEPLVLAAWSRELDSFDSARTIEVDAEAIDTVSFDRDGDGVSNLAEREGDRDPLVAEAPDAPTGDDDAEPSGADPSEQDDVLTDPGAPLEPLVTGPTAGEDPALDVVLNFIDPAVAADILIDGGFDQGPAWEGAKFADEFGQQLWLNRLLGIDSDDATDPTLQDGVPDYIWFGMHDGTFLYLFVQSEAAGDGPQTPQRDSQQWFNDDAISLIIDPNLSREPALQSDDLFLGLPLVALPGEDRPPVISFNGLLPIPPGGVYDACPCPGSRSGWELKIPLAEIGLSVGQPFGLELQIHEDKDGGGRDALYGWATPPIERQGDQFLFESPAQLGTVVLAEP